MMETDSQHRNIQEVAVAEKSPDTGSAASAPTEDDSAEQGPVTDDTKSAFAAALERKKQAGQARSAHLDGHGGVGGATSNHKATRTFRRKSV